MNISNDRELLNQLKQDDPAAFEKLFILYHKRVYAFAFRIMPSAYDAEEIVQNVFMAVWNQRRSLNVYNSFLSYLFGTARHMVYDMIQQKIRFNAFAEYYLNLDQNYSFITEEVVLYNELAEIMQQLINDLPERRKEIFTLSRVDGLSYSEIAERLGISENTVDTQIRNALNYLRNKIDGLNK